MLQIRVNLLQIHVDLQQNLRSGPSASESQALSQEVGGLGIVEVLQIDPVLQQDNRRMLQISRGLLRRRDYVRPLSLSMSRIALWTTLFFFFSCSRHPRQKIE